RNAPTMRSAIAPTTSSNSGKTASSPDIWSGRFIRAAPGSRQERGGLRRAERVAVGLEQARDRRGRQIEHRLRKYAEQDGEDDERRERDYLATVEILERRQRRLFERAEHDLAVEPERVGGGQDHAGRGERGDPDFDLVGADEAQEFADEPGRSRQSDIGEREHHDRRRV